MHRGGARAERQRSHDAVPCMLALIPPSHETRVHRQTEDVPRRTDMPHVKVDRALVGAQGMVVGPKFCRSFRSALSGAALAHASRACVCLVVRAFVASELQSMQLTLQQSVERFRWCLLTCALKSARVLESESALTPHVYTHHNMLEHN